MDQRKAQMRFARAPELPILAPERAFELGVDAVLITSFSAGKIARSIEERGWDVELADLYAREPAP